MATLKVNAQPTFRLQPITIPGKTTPEKGKFRAIITHRETYDTEQVIQEMLDRSGHHMSASMVEPVVLAVGIMPKISGKELRFSQRARQQTLPRRIKKNG